MSEVVPIKSYVDIPNTLRRIADDIESGETPVRNLTIVAEMQVYHLGTLNEDTAALETVFNLNVGLARMMSLISRYGE